MAATISTFDTDSVTKAKKRSVGDHFEVRGTMHLGTSYATNGVAVTASLFGLARLDDVQVFPTGSDTPVYDKANKKIKLFTADGTEAANAANVSSAVFNFVARGR